ncbi:MAG TPA: hypothetical protein VJJ72_01490 [Candidatus Paceibacterota bacterium]
MAHVIKDASVLLLSVLVAVIIAQLQLIENILLISENIRIVGSFIAGLFFTSVFTTAPAIVALGEISQVEPLFTVAFVGAIGAVCGDILIFYLFKNHVANDLDELIHLTKHKGLKSVFKHKYLKWLVVLCGALIISSPLPDELGIAMMGISRLKFNVFIPLSFSFNFLGILVIGLVSRAIV